MSALPGWWPQHWRQPDGQLRDKHGIMWVPTDTADWNAGGNGNPQPDPADPATIGCLTHLVREMWGDPSAHTRFSRSRGVWEVSVHHELCRDLCGPTEYAALLAAGDAAWARRGGAP